MKIVQSIIVVFASPTAFSESVVYVFYWLLCLNAKNAIRCCIGT